VKKLTLRRETLTALDGPELARVAGAAPSVFCTSAVTFCDVVCTATERAKAITQAAVNPSLLCPTTA
jgi:hypothetical protein